MFGQKMPIPFALDLKIAAGLVFIPNSICLFSMHFIEGLSSTFADNNKLSNIRIYAINRIEFSSQRKKVGLLTSALATNLFQSIYRQSPSPFFFLFLAIAFSLMRYVSLTLIHQESISFYVTLLLTEKGA